jgi:hypothetical protein
MHYHGTPITPITALYELAGRNFCVSFAHPQDVARCHQIGQSVMLDNGAFSKWKSGKDTNWDGFYAWCDEWPKVCIGSTAEYAAVLSESWERRMDEVFNLVAKKHLPWLHMLRGMQTLGLRWPFASVDSTDIAQNHHRPQNTPRAMADRWDAIQCKASWETRPEQMELA